MDNRRKFIALNDDVFMAESETFLFVFMLFVSLFNNGSDKLFVSVGSGRREIF